MKYKAYALELLHKLGIQKIYKGCEYIIASMSYIASNEKLFTPVTKILYVEIAKQYNTSNLCVEKNMRAIIKRIWARPENKGLICEIFGEHNLAKRPSNVEFLMLLYNYLKYERGNDHSDKKVDYTFICPLSGNTCEFCKEFVIETIHKMNE